MSYFKNVVSAAAVVLSLAPCISNAHAYDASKQVTSAVAEQVAANSKGRPGEYNQVAANSKGRPGEHQIAANSKGRPGEYNQVAANSQGRPGEFLTQHEQSAV